MRTPSPRPGPAEARAADTRAALGALAAIATAMLAALYGLAVHTEAGRRVDAAALAVERPERSLAWLATSMSLRAFGALVLLGLAGTYAVARRSGRRHLATTTTWLILGTALLAELAKRALPRPAGDLDSMGPSFPSGHTAVALALGFALLLAAPRSLRRALHVAVPLFAASVAVGVVLLQWHRPSDALGGILLALAWGTALLARGLHRARPRAAHERSPLSSRLATPEARRVATFPFLAIGAAVAAAELLLTLQEPSPLLRAVTAITALAAVGAVTLWERLAEPHVDRGRLD